MIGVHTSEILRPFAEELFELFKTPWEFYSPERSYDAVICCGVEPMSYGTGLILIFPGTSELNAIRRSGSAETVTFLTYQEDKIPIYTNQGSPVVIQTEEESSGDGQTVTTVRISYNLFLEIAFLLKWGQPARNAAIPATELHISLLRDLLIQYTEYLVEIIPTPAGYSMIACLTHDVDHPSIRRSRISPTVLGFLYRATLGSIMEVCRGRKNLGQLLINWRAALSLPLIYAGLAKDIWDSFDTYTGLEKPRPSTYFFIPTKNHAGRDKNGVEHSKRASAYAASELNASISSLRNEGREIGVHGIDGWHDKDEGMREREAISNLTGERELGVRMHWLYHHEQSAMELEEAGYNYDSTVGYNDTVGYRAGTTQIFKPTGANRLLELPLHIMDTALFYPTYLDLTEKEASDLISRMVLLSRRFGGVITVNWHDRSLAPERLWGKVYQNIIQRLTESGAWFATCRDAVAWFRCRRAMAFDRVSVNADTGLNASVRSNGERIDLPPARLRVHAGRGARFCGEGDLPYRDFEITEPWQAFQVAMRFDGSRKVCATK